MLFKLLIILFLLIVFMGEERGLASFGALVINVITMIAMVYLMARGINPYLVSFTASVLITYFTLVYQNGKNIKSILSIISVILVMAVLSLGIIWIVNNSHIGGFYCHYYSSI